MCGGSQRSFDAKEGTGEQKGGSKPPDQPWREKSFDAPGEGMGLAVPVNTEGFGLAVLINTDFFGPYSITHSECLSLTVPLYGGEPTEL